MNEVWLVWHGEYPDELTVAGVAESELSANVLVAVARARIDRARADGRHGLSNAVQVDGPFPMGQLYEGWLGEWA
jgi:hypothetical protein